MITHGPQERDFIAPYNSFRLNVPRDFWRDAVCRVCVQPNLSTKDRKALSIAGGTCA